MTSYQRAALYNWTLDAERRLRVIERNLFISQVLRFAVQVAGALAFVGLVYLAFHVAGIAFEG